MNKFFFVLAFSFIFNSTKGQTSFDKLIKHKGDSVLKSFIGTGINRIILKYKEGYHDKNDFRATYKVDFPDNNYSDELIIYFDKSFNVVDSNFLRTFPDYVLEDRQNDLISKDSAISSAKNSGLCLGDILDISFYRLYYSKIFVWVIDADNEKERQKAKLESKRRAVTRRTMLKCRTRIVNAKTGEIIIADTPSTNSR